jgi:Tetratricopeptide repeat
MIRIPSALLFTAVVGLGLAFAAPAGAQSPADKAAAQKMFDDAKPLMEAGQYAQACALLEESQKLDPGMAAAFRLGECYEKAGRLASAWTTFVEVADAARNAAMNDRERVARERAAALAPRLSYLVIKVPEAVAATPGLTIQRDGTPIGRAQWGAAVPVDSGNHRVVAEAPGKAAWSRDVEMKTEAANVEVTVVALTDAAAPPKVDGPSGPPKGPAEAGSGGGTQATLGLVIAGVGLAGVGAGVVVGLLAKSKYDDSSDHCMENFCNEEGLSIRDSARSQGTAATVVFAIGAAALVGGGVLWLTAPSSDETTARRGRAEVRVGVTPGGLVAKGTW